MPTPSLLSGVTVQGRRSTFKFLSDAASVLTQSRRKSTSRISTLVGSAAAPSHDRALKLAGHVRTVHARRHRHDVQVHSPNALVSLVTVCHDVCGRCRTPYLDILDEEMYQEIDRHLVGLIHDLSVPSYGHRIWAARYICVLHTAHPLLSARFSSLGLQVSAEMSLHQVKNAPESAEDEKALEALQLLILATGTHGIIAFALHDLFQHRPLAKPELWDAFLCSMLDRMRERNILELCFRTRLTATMEYALKRYSIEDTTRSMFVVHARLDPVYMLQAWSAQEEHWRFLFALYTTGHPRTLHRTSSEQLAQWRSAWLPLLGWLSLPPTIDNLRKVHFWVEGIDHDIRQMYPLLLPDDLASQISHVHETLLERPAPLIKGRRDIPTRILENALAGSTIVRWASAGGCSPRIEEFYRNFLERADRRPPLEVAYEPEAPSSELSNDMAFLRGTSVFHALCVVLQEISLLANGSWVCQEEWGHGNSSPTMAASLTHFSLRDEEEGDDASSTTTAVWASNATWMEEDDDDAATTVVSAI